MLLQAVLARVAALEDTAASQSGCIAKQDERIAEQDARIAEQDEAITHLQNERSAKGQWRGLQRPGPRSYTPVS